MNGQLRELVRRYLENSEYYESTRGILRMGVTVVDFSDELFDSFEPSSRARLIPLLLVWCKEHARPILERRLRRERDKECLTRVKAVLFVLKHLSDPAVTSGGEL